MNTLADGVGSHRGTLSSFALSFFVFVELLKCEPSEKTSGAPSRTLMACVKRVVRFRRGFSLNDKVA